MRRFFLIQDHLNDFNETLEFKDKVYGSPMLLMLWSTALCSNEPGPPPPSLLQITDKTDPRVKSSLITDHNEAPSHICNSGHGGREMAAVNK